MDQPKNYNENYFDIIDTPQKAYFLGLLYADGCISHTTRTSGSICYIMAIALQEDDKYVLEKFRIEMERPNNLLFIRGNDHRKAKFCFTVSGEKIHHDLEKHGCVERKSLILQFPTTVPEELMSHFIRGYFDGDGCI